MKKIKKIISVIIIISLFFTYATVSVYANSTEPVTEKTTCKVLKGAELAQIRSKYSITAKTEKITYLKAVFNHFGMNEKAVEYLDDKKINSLAEADEFGYKTLTIKESSKGLSSASREFEVMSLALVWGRNGSTYDIAATQEWKTLPTMRSDDIISLDLGGGSVVTGSQCAALMYSNNETIYTEEFTNQSPEYIGIQSACAFKIGLPTSADELGMFISYSVTKYSTDNTISMQYFHKWSPWVFSISVSYYVGISVSPSSIFTEYSLQCGTAN